MPTSVIHVETGLLVRSGVDKSVRSFSVKVRVILSGSLIDMREHTPGYY